MKVIELGKPSPELEELVRASQDEDVVFTRDGKPLAIMGKFTPEEWEEWLVEHSPEAIARSQKALKDYRQGRYTTLKEFKRKLRTQEKQE